MPNVTFDLPMYNCMTKPLTKFKADFHLAEIPKKYCAIRITRVMAHNNPYGTILCHKGTNQWHR
jgi:hypothetical protein